MAGLLAGLPLRVAAPAPVVVTALHRRGDERQHEDDGERFNSPSGALVAAADLGQHDRGVYPDAGEQQAHGSARQGIGQKVHAPPQRRARAAAAPRGVPD